MINHNGRVVIVLLLAVTLATLLLALSPGGGTSHQGYALMATGTQNFDPYVEKPSVPSSYWVMPCPTPPPSGGSGSPAIPPPVNAPAKRPPVIPAPTISEYGIEKPSVPSSYWVMPCPTPPPSGGSGSPAIPPYGTSPTAVSHITPAPYVPGLYNEYRPPYGPTPVRTDPAQPGTVEAVKGYGMQIQIPDRSPKTPAYTQNYPGANLYTKPLPTVPPQIVAKPGLPPSKFLQQSGKR